MDGKRIVPNVDELEALRAKHENTEAQAHLKLYEAAEKEMHLKWDEMIRAYRNMLYVVLYLQSKDYESKKKSSSVGEEKKVKDDGVGGEGVPVGGVPVFGVPVINEEDDSFGDNFVLLGTEPSDPDMEEEKKTEESKLEGDGNGDDGSKKPADGYKIDY